MTLTDYLFDSLLVLLVVRQVRESRFDHITLLMPLGIIVAVGGHYLHDVPTGRADLVLISVLTGLGLVAGIVSGSATRVRSDGGRYALVKAGWVAAGVWVTSMGARFAFAVWASHGGGPELYRFSVGHHLDNSAWTAALVLMAFAEVLTRTGILFVRTRRVLAAAPWPAPRDLVSA